MMARRSFLTGWILIALCTIICIAGLDKASAQVELYTGSENLVTLEADNASLTSVFQVLTEKSGWNIVTGPSIEGRRISIRVVDVPVEEAFDLVVKAAGLGYEKIGSSILVEDPELLGEEASLQSFVVKLNYSAGSQAGGSFRG
jgi:type II secretory pathway component HofQ